MSINYEFTDRGTIQVWCGDDWIEIRLPGGGGGGGSTAKPRPKTPDLSDPNSNAGPVAVPDEDGSDLEPEPQVGPGSMSFIGMVGGRGRRPSALLLRTPPAGQGRPRLMQLERFEPEVDLVSQMLSTPNPGDVQIITIDVSQLPLKSPLSAVQLHQLLRKWEADGGGAGVGSQEREE